jgi:hypothetical protein
MKARFMFLVLTATALAASWGGWLADPSTWSDGVF